MNESISQDNIDELNRIANEALNGLFPIVITPSSRYWECHGYQFHYTTERVEGKFWAMIYRPVGKGARSKPHEWKLAKKASRKRRKDAKALAYKWYEKERGNG